MNDEEALARIRSLAETEKAPPGLATWRVADLDGARTPVHSWREIVRRPLGVVSAGAAGIAVLTIGLVASLGPAAPGHHPLAKSPNPVVTATAGVPTSSPVSASASPSLSPTPAHGAPPAQTSAPGPAAAIAVSTWGNRGNGGAGDGTPHGGSNSSTPHTLNGLTSVVTASGSGSNGYAVKSDGSVWAWGSGWAGQLGNGTWSESDTPVQVPGLNGVVQIATGDNHVVVLKSDGTVWSWGRNDHGQLGDATTVSRDYPEQVCAPGQPYSNPVPTANLGVTTPASPCKSFLSGVVGVTVGGGQNFALKSDGSVYAWGAAWSNLLGIGTPVANPCPKNPWESDGPYQCAPVPTPVCGGTSGNMSSPCSTTLTGVRKLFAGGSAAYAIMNDGTVRAWGENQFGQMGNGTTCSTWPGCSEYYSPVAVPALTGVTEIAGGGQHALALTPSGTVLAWGDNGSGQLGNDSACNGGVDPCVGSAAPIPVPGLANVTQIAAANDFSAAVESNGTLWTWGDNGSGQLGRPQCGSEPCYATGDGKPVEVGGISNVIAVYLEDATVIALHR